MNILSRLCSISYKPNCQTHISSFSLLHTHTTLLANKPNNPQQPKPPLNLPKPSLNLIQHPLNLDHPILSKLEKCQNITQFNQIHGLIITTGMSRNVFAASRLIIISSFSLDPPNIPLSYLLFTQIQNPDVYTYNIIIKASSQTSNPLLISLNFYQKLLFQGLQPNEYTFCFLFASSAHALDLQMGKQIQSHFIKHGFNMGVFATTSLLHMYSECGDLSNAIQAFDEMHQKTDVSWGAMIDAYVSRGFLIDGLRLFAEMRSLGVEASNATLVKVLCVCAKLQKLVLGRMVHNYVEVRGLELNVTLGTSLVDMYSKCGDIEMAMNVFSMMPVKSVVSWNCMINGLAMNGRAEAAINLFREMEALGENPNAATLVGVLNSCSHAGLVSDGIEYFSKMSEVYEIVPNVKHYGCVVDLYGRAGMFEEALDVIRRMPMKPDSVTWGALLGACRIHGHSKLGELVAAQVIKLVQPDRITVSGLSDMYAMAGQWDDVVRVRKRMMDKYSVKEPGFSSISN